MKSVEENISNLSGHNHCCELSETGYDDLPCQQLSETGYDELPSQHIFNYSCVSYICLDYCITSNAL